MIDITKPLELSDGTRVTLKESCPYWLLVGGEFGDFNHCFFELDGSANSTWKDEAKGRTLRNVKSVSAPLAKICSFETNEQPDKVVVNGVSYMKTSEECLQRMEALLRRIASYSGAHPGTLVTDEARAIVAEIDKTKGPSDVAIMQDILREDYGPLDNPNNCEGPKRVKDILDGKVDYWEARLALKCIAKGRELEAEQRMLHVENYNPDAIEIKFESNYDIRVALKPLKSGELRRG